MNHYAQAIDKLMGNPDLQAIAQDYAKRHPADFVRAAKPNQTKLDAELRHMLGCDKKIQAIKYHREITGSGLKDAKDYVESL